MSVCLAEVVENNGETDFRNNVNDAQWLLRQRENFEEMCADAEDLLRREGLLPYEEDEKTINTTKGEK